MFERFNDDSRRAVRLAQEEARRLRASHVGPEHLLLGLLDLGEGPAYRALRDHDLDSAETRGRLAFSDDTLDPAVLATIGIDLEEVRRATEEAFGEGALDGAPGEFKDGRRHIRFSADAKKALELSLRHAIRLGHKPIDSGHLLLGILHLKNARVTWLLEESDVDPDALNAHITRLITSDAA